MHVEIRIAIEATEEDFVKDELISDIKYQFADITGYEIESIDVNSTPD